MATRNTRLIIKNSDIVNRPLPSSLIPGEPIVNIAEGVVYFSGVTTSTNQWTPAGTGTTANFFEVGSNLYDLRLRNKITKYEGQSGSSLIGKFLSGTTSGFVLADITDIAASTNSYVTGATWNPNILKLDLNLGKPSVSVNIDAFSALTITSDLFVNGGLTSNDLTITGTGIYNGIANGSNTNEIVNWSSLTAHTSTTDKYVTGGTYDNSTALITFSGANNFPQFTVDLSTIDVNDTFITGGTISYDLGGLNGTLTLTDNDGSDVIITGFTDVQTTGATLVGSTVVFDTNQSLSAYTLDLSALDVNDTFVTGFTYNPSTNTITISRNEGQPDLSINVNSVSGLTFNNLTPGRVVYVGAGGELTDESGFEYNDGTNLLTVGNLFVNNPSGTTANIGQGGLVIGSGGSSSTPGIGDLVVHGDLTVFGGTTTISTSELYIEDPQITLNYNPTGDTSVTSIGSGILIQDGGGVAGQDVKIGIGQLFGSSISGDTSEYTTTTGFENRGWVTQLNDIVIRNSSPVNFGDPDGVRVLTEGDFLDGGNY
jgi:hypothetical protein